MVQVENTEDLTGPSGAQRRVKIVKVRSPKRCICDGLEVALSCSTVQASSARIPGASWAD